MAPLIHDNIAFHNAAALEPFCGLPGLCLARVPGQVRKTLNPGARATALQAVGVELRFVCEGPRVRLALAAHQEEVSLRVYRGDFAHAESRVPAGATRVLQLDLPEHFGTVDRTGALEGGRFSPDLWRVQISGGVASYVGVESFGDALRPPREDETPRIRWLAHGSSITQSWAGGYPHVAARLLGVDVLNKGLSGSCHCEATLADWFAESECWDFATLELGVNMRGVFSPEEFEGRARGVVDRLRAANPEAPLVLITHFTNRDHAPAHGGGSTRIQKNQMAYDNILRDIARENAEDRVHLIEGREVLDGFHGLSSDLLHPSDHGHESMGHALAGLLRGHLPGL